MRNDIKFNSVVSVQNYTRRTGSRAKFITRTVLFLVVAAAFQLLGGYITPYGNYIAGTVVSAVIVIAAWAAGLWSGIAISAAVPLVSLLTVDASAASVLPAFTPLIIAGNIIWVLCYYFISKRNDIIALLTGAVLKFGFLFGAAKAFVGLMNLQQDVSGTLFALSGWPQLITTLAGGAISYAVIRLIGK